MKIKKQLLAIFTAMLLGSNSVSFVYAEEAAPTPVPQTEAPSAPSSPSAPSAPKTPDAPKDLEPAATPKPAATPVPSVVQEEVLEPTPEASPQAEPTNVNSDDSGGEVAGGNTGIDSTINTGDAATNGAITNTGNINLVSTGSGASLLPSGGTTVSNTDNGSGSTNTGTVNQGASVTTDQSNSASVVNELNQNSSTGDNINNSNTGGDTTINTGNANTSGTILNMLNTNAAGVTVSEFNIVDDQMGDYILDFGSNCISGCAPSDSVNVSNGGNGESSQNTGMLNSDSTTAAFQTNAADIENDMTLEANTGDNIADRNTNGNSTINTGDANVSASIGNFANNNFAGDVYLGLVNIYGDLDGDLILPEIPGCSTCGGSVGAANSGNGDSTINNASADISDEYILAQTNTADIKNNVNIDAVTGDNSTSRNTGGNNSIETGEANILASVINVANNNIAGGDWWLVIVNEAGNWIGKILGAPDGANMAASQGTQISEDANGQINVSNNANGAGSQNNAAVDQSTSDTTIQNNDANIINNVNLVANTGGNSTSRNTGGQNSVTTGDANVILNIINFVNNNVAGGGRLFVTLVNVFGSWTGDFVSPGNEKSEEPAENNNGIGGVAEIPQSSQNSNSGGSSSPSSSGSSSSTATVLASTSSVGSYSNRGLSSTGSIASGETDEKLALKADVNKPGGSPAKGVTLNLAWGLLLIPLYFIMRSRAIQSIVGVLRRRSVSA